jgi:hypothetical protein
MANMRQKQPCATYFMDLNWCVIPYHTKKCCFWPGDISLQCTSIMAVTWIFSLTVALMGISNEHWNRKCAIWYVARTLTYLQRWQILIWRSGLAEGYTMQHVNIPLHLTSRSGFVTAYTYKEVCWQVNNYRHSTDRNSEVI